MTELSTHLQQLEVDVSWAATPARLPDARFDAWVDKVAAVPAADVEEVAEHLVALALKYAPAGAEARELIGQLVALTACVGLGPAPVAELPAANRQRMEHAERLLGIEAPKLVPAAADGRRGPLALQLQEKGGKK